MSYTYLLERPCVIRSWRYSSAYETKNMSEMPDHKTSGLLLQNHGRRTKVMVQGLREVLPKIYLRSKPGQGAPTLAKLESEVCRQDIQRQKGEQGKILHLRTQAKVWNFKAGRGSSTGGKWKRVRYLRKGIQPIHPTPQKESRSLPQDGNGWIVYLLALQHFTRAAG